MKIVILAGGLGTRLSEETRNIPKPMVKIGNYPILYHIMKYYSKFNHKNFIICTGYKANEIKNFSLILKFKIQILLLTSKVIEQKYITVKKID